MSTSTKQITTVSASLVPALRRLYYSAVWHADRPVDEEALWTAVRDEAGFPPGESPEEIPFQGVRVEYTIDRLRQLAGYVRPGATTEDIRAFLLLYGGELGSKIDKTVRDFLQEKLG
jgi:hypothetical protein